MARHPPAIGGELRRSFQLDHTQAGEHIDEKTSATANIEIRELLDFARMPRYDEHMFASLIELLQSTGPVALNELVMRSSESPEELVCTLEDLRRSGIVVVTGPRSEDLSKMTAEDIARSSETIVELSREGVRRSFAS